jgi:hypothetical protein
MALFGTYRSCPYHGGDILLEDCPIVATNELVAVDLRKQLAGADATAPPPSPSQAPDPNDELFEEFDNRAVDAPPSQVAPPRRNPQGPVKPASQMVRGDEAPSRIDQKRRLVLAPCPKRKQQEAKRRGLFSRQEEALSSPVELAADFGGARARPARLCPHPSCLHPLPAAIDDRDPFLLAIVGNGSASKTTLLAALVDIGRRQGAGAFGLEEFAPTERTMSTLREILRDYRDGVRSVTERAVRRDLGSVLAMPPLEILMSWPGAADPIVLLVHDVAGEDYMDLDLRIECASHILWADAVLFVANPEEMPEIDSYTSTIEQSTLLSGVHHDILSGPRRDRVPPLIVALSKADLVVGHELSPEDYGDEEAVVATIKRLGGADVLEAARRWETDVRFCAVSPNPQLGAAEGVAGLFRLVFDKMIESAR